METRIAELNSGRPVSVAGQGVERIRNMEPILAKLEAEQEKAAEQEEEKVKAKVGELQTSLRALQEKKEAEIANKRKTMSLELNNLRGTLFLAI
jgi:Skp family chaperone for outer membrane proteins